MPTRSPQTTRRKGGPRTAASNLPWSAPAPDEAARGGAKMNRASLVPFALIGGPIGVVLLAGCSQPNSNTAAGRSDITGQQCAICIATNPGDYDACHAIC